MGRSSLLGLEFAADEPAGRDTAALGPGDNSDSGSDISGLHDADSDDPVERHPTQAGFDLRRAGARDIGVDRIFKPGRAHGAAKAGARPHEDEDPDLAFIDGATAGVPPEDEVPEDDDGEGGGLGNEGDNIPGAPPSPQQEPAGRKSGA